MLVAFPMAAEVPAPEEAEEPESSGAAEPDVLAPYSELEVPGSYYVCGVALVPEARGQGLGTAFMEIARSEARERELLTLSLLVFEQNVGAVRLYERLGYRVVDRRPVVPHPLIRYTGDVLLMVAPA
jgi:ribosomal protein S18 acetylase RimI-like enzyme